jgi:hypothetical protein
MPNQHRQTTQWLTLKSNLIDLATQDLAKTAKSCINTTVDATWVYTVITCLKGDQNDTSNFY